MVKNKGSKMRYKKKDIYGFPTIEMVEECVRSHNLSIDPQKAYDYWEKKQWKTKKGVKVKSLEKSTPIKEGDDGLSYNGTGDESGRIYLFKNGKLSSSAMVVRYTYSSILADFLLERYMVIDVDKSKQTSTFVNGLTEETITMGIGTSIDGNMFIVLYIPMTDIATRSIFQIGNEETIAR